MHFRKFSVSVKLLKGQTLITKLTSATKCNYLNTNVCAFVYKLQKNMINVVLKWCVQYNILLSVLSFEDTLTFI